VGWEYDFMDRQSEFVELMNIERGELETNENDPIRVD
jgi:hypothetical protein